MHIPLQLEGSMLSVSDAGNAIQQFVYVPFGTFLAVRADVCHSGPFGNAGSIQFHAVIGREGTPPPHVPSPIKCGKLMEEKCESDFRAFFDYHCRKTNRISMAHAEMLTQMNYQGHCSPSENTCSFDNFTMK